MLCENYSTNTIILKNKFRDNILEYLDLQLRTTNQNSSQSPHSSQFQSLTVFFRQWKSKSDNHGHYELSIVLQLLLSPNIYSRILTLEHYMNQLNYNNTFIEDFVNDFLINKSK